MWGAFFFPLLSSLLFFQKYQIYRIYILPFLVYFVYPILRIRTELRREWIFLNCKLTFLRVLKNQSYFLNLTSVRFGAEAYETNRHCRVNLKWRSKFRKRFVFIRRLKFYCLLFICSNEFFQKVRSAIFFQQVKNSLVWNYFSPYHDKIRLVWS